MRPAAARVILLLAASTALSCSRPAGDYYGSVERSGKDRTTFYVNNHDEPEYLDPTLAVDAASSVLIYDLYEGLFNKHPEDLRPVQGVATRYDQSDDNRIFRFQLRPEARWSDGRPVTAGDFVYAWRRVLTPKTGARGATHMYVLKNGQLFHQGRLRQTQRAVRLQAAPDRSEGPELPAGAVVRLELTRQVKISLPPLSEPLSDASLELKYQKPKQDEPAKLLIEGAGRPATIEAPATTAAVIARRGPIRCNGGADHLYELSAGGRRGFLPGCALEEDVTASKWALVERHRDLPTFRPEPAPQGATAPREEPLGFVRLADLRPADPSVIGVRARSDHVLEVELSKPTPYFIELCGYVTFMPVRQDLIERFEQLGNPDGWYRPEHIIVNGPYTLESWRLRYELSFKQNPYHYAHDRLKIHRIVWFSVADQNANMNLYRTGEIDYLGTNASLPAPYLDLLSGYKDFIQARYLATYWYELNVKKPPLDNPKVRRALSLAVDRQQLVDRITLGGQKPATHFVPDYTGSGYDKQAAADRAAGTDPFSGPEVGFQPGRARELLREAGYEVVEKGQGWEAKGFPPLELLYNTGGGHQKIAVAVQDMLKRHLGITVSLRNEEFRVMLKSMRDGHFQMARFSWNADYNHPHTFMDLFLSYSQNNWTGYSNPEVDALIEQAARTADQKESIRLYRQAEKLVVDDAPRLPLYFYTWSTLIKPYVKGFYPNAFKHYQMRWLWLDEGWRRDSANRPSYTPEELPPPGRIVAGRAP